MCIDLMVFLNVQHATDTCFGALFPCLTAAWLDQASSGCKITWLQTLQMAFNDDLAMEILCFQIESCLYELQTQFT